ncbi:hypothetical protein RQP46_004776 [Phenoliferia psychrophenolica]
MELQNALLLGKLLNRTVHSIAFEKAKARWASKGFEVASDGYPITNLTAKDCKSYSAECRHTYIDSFLSWSFLVDLDKAQHMRERSIESLLGVQPEDVYVLRDETAYDMQYTHGGDPTSELVVAAPSKSKFSISRAMAFRNPHIIRPADAIRDRLGGSQGYVGVHARVGDGAFVTKAAENMEKAWRTVASRLGIDAEATEEMWTQVQVRNVRRKRSGRLMREEGRDWSMLDVDLDAGHTADDDIPDPPTKRADTPTSPFFLPPLQDLKCRSPLHTSPPFLPFNTPVYIATDSRSPTTDVNLSPFFAAFPCTFILSDFDRPSEINGYHYVPSVGAMLRLVNDADGVPLGRLLLPFLEAVVVAKGFVSVGTGGSTFSGKPFAVFKIRVQKADGTLRDVAYAAGELHNAYAEDH